MGWKDILSYVVLAAACVYCLSIGLPTINNNINESNLIRYFNNDEGCHMDLMWFYYSGQKLPTLRWDYDYGLELLYLSDLSRLILSRFIHFEPATFVLIFRWIHLISWILALIALWYFVGRHFGKGWQQALAVLLLAARPAFAYVLTNMKPEPLVLLFMILGLHYTLLIVERPVLKNIALACLFAALAFLTKFSGIFLLPGIVSAIYISEVRRQNDPASAVGCKAMPVFKAAWAFPSLVGIALLGALLSAILFYVRKSTGSTWCAEFGFWGSITNNKYLLALFACGASLVILSVLIKALEAYGPAAVKRFTRFINTANSYALIVSSIFFIMILILGFRWVITPQYFINTYSQIFCSASNASVGLVEAEGIVRTFVRNLTDQFRALDPMICVLFLSYVIIEISAARRNAKAASLVFFKRMALLSFLAIPLLYSFSMLRMAQHHMLPFFVVMSVLGIQGLDMMISSGFSGRRTLKKTVVLFAAMLFLADIGVNAFESLKMRIYEFHQKDDVVFDIARWWRANYPPDTLIVSDHPSFAYLPMEYNNVKYFKSYQKDKVERLRELVYKCHPRLVYYNEWLSGPDKMPFPAEIFPGKAVRFVKIFENAGRPYQKWPGSRFVVYEVSD